VKDLELTKAVVSKAQNQKKENKTEKVVKICKIEFNNRFGEVFA